jgi:hypothetical protein
MAELKEDRRQARELINRYPDDPADWTTYGSGPPAQGRCNAQRTSAFTSAPRSSFAPQTAPPTSGHATGVAPHRVFSTPPITSYDTASGLSIPINPTPTRQFRDEQSCSQTDLSAAVDDLASRIVTEIINKQTNSGHYVSNPRLKVEIASMIAGLPMPPPSLANTTNSATASNFSDASAYNPHSMYTEDPTGPSWISVG